MRVKDFKDLPRVSKKAAYWKKMKISVFERTILLGFGWFAGEAGFCWDPILAETACRCSLVI